MVSLYIIIEVLIQLQKMFKVGLVLLLICACCDGKLFVLQIRCKQYSVVQAVYGGMTREQTPLISEPKYPA